MLKKILVGFCCLVLGCSSGSITSTTDRVTASNILTACMENLSGAPIENADGKNEREKEEKETQKSCNAEEVAEINKRDSCFLEHCKQASDYKSFAAASDDCNDKIDITKLSANCKGAAGLGPRP